MEEPRRRPLRDDHADPDLQEREGRYCREYTQTVLIGGEEHTAYGRACRRPDGSWQIVK